MAACTTLVAELCGHNAMVAEETAKLDAAMQLTLSLVPCFSVSGANWKLTMTWGVLPSMICDTHKTAVSCGSVLLEIMLTQCLLIKEQLHWGSTCSLLPTDPL